MRSAFQSQEVAAFTLIEMMVVIGVIGVLTALLLPVLSKARDRARTVSCANDLKQLQTSWHLYASENSDVLPPNNFVLDSDDFPVANGPSWCPDRAREDEDTKALESGALFPYVRSVDVYHCPADRSTVVTLGGEALSRLRNRSYNMSQSVNGGPVFSDEEGFITNTPSVKKLAEIRRPPPSDLFVFIDEHADTLHDAHFGNPPVGSAFFSAYQGRWSDMPADRHSQGCNVSFADGHVERWAWKVPKIFQSLGQIPSESEGPDYARIQKAMVQPSDLQ